MPSGWVGSFDDPQPLLGPGESRDIFFTLTSAGMAVDGYYDVPLSAVHGADSSLVASDTVSYVVDSGPSNSAPVAVDDFGTVKPGESVNLSVLLNDSDADGDTLILEYVLSPSMGQVAELPDGSVLYQANTDAKGTDYFEYSVSDGVDSAVAMIEIKIDRRGGKGKGRRK